MNNITVAIADDHQMVLNGLKDMVAGSSNILVADTYLNGTDLLMGLEVKQPNVLLLDIRMPDESGIDLVPLILKKYPHLRILILTNFDNTLYVHTLLNAGAHGYLLKDTDQHTLIEAIEAVYNGEEYLKPEVREKLNEFRKTLKRNASSRIVLTPREKEILELIAREYSSQEIAEELSLSLRTVENYRLNLNIKLEVKNTAGLIKVALELGLITL